MNVQAQQNDTIGLFCWRYYGRTAGVTRRVIDANKVISAATEFGRPADCLPARDPAASPAGNRAAMGLRGGYNDTPPGITRTNTKWIVTICRHCFALVRRRAGAVAALRWQSLLKPPDRWYVGLSRLLWPVSRH